MKDIETGKELHDELFTMKKTWYRPLPEHIKLLKGGKLLVCRDSEIHEMSMNDATSFDDAKVYLTISPTEQEFVTVSFNFKDIDCWAYAPSTMPKKSDYEKSNKEAKT